MELFPRFWEPYHSDNAYQEVGDSKFENDGSLKPNLTTKVSTNNFTQTAVREIDHLINKYRDEEDLGKITEMAHQLSKMIHDHAVWVPAWKKPWLRIGHWNWVKFPEDWGPKETRDYEEFQGRGCSDVDANPDSRVTGGSCRHPDQQRHSLCPV